VAEFTTRTAGLESLTAKLARIPPGVQAAAQGANDANALDFEQKVASIIPVKDGTLVSTLTKGPGKKPLSVQVSIGGPEAPYPAHLEFGQMDHGKHVRAEPFWFPTLRVMRKRFRDRASRAASAAIRAIAGGG